MIDNKPYALTRKNTAYQEENKAPLASREERLDNKYAKAKRASYSRPLPFGMPKNPVEVPQNSRHMMKFCLGEKNNKLLNREVKTSDHLDMYTTKVNRSNARINYDMQSKRMAAKPPVGITIPFMWK